MSDRAFLGMFLSILFVVVFTVAMHAVGKYQLCEHYFPEMNRAACFFTQLPAVTGRR